MEVYEVVSPAGKSVAERGFIAPRLDTLAGKTICEVSGGDTPFRCEWSFPIIRDVLQKRYPDAKVIPYTEFPTISAQFLHPETKEETWAALRAALREKGCEGVISQLGA